jgi:hypothetical protein
VRGRCCSGAGSSNLGSREGAPCVYWKVPVYTSILAILGESAVCGRLRLWENRGAHKSGSGQAPEDVGTSEAA